MPAPSAPPGLKLPVAIVGGGITGLAAATELHRAGIPFRLFEASPRLGGVIRTEKHPEGWLVEAGPNSFLLNQRRVREFLETTGAQADLIEAAPAAKVRYLVRGGRLLAVPSSPASFLTTPLWGLGAKFRLFSDLFSKPLEREQDVPLGELVAEHFGQEFVDYALNPFVSGVYAGDVTQLSAKYSFPHVWKCEREYGSLLRGIRAHLKAKKKSGEPKSRMISFRDGLETLPQRLIAALPAASLSTSAKVTHLTPARHGAPWLVRWEDDREHHIETFSAVLLAAPAHALAELSFGNQGSKPLSRLGRMKYPPITSLFLGYKKAEVPHDLGGFGVLVPQKESSPVLGILFSSTLFPGRAPEGHVALTVMIGGSLNPHLTSLDSEKLLAVVRPELEKLLGIRVPPCFSRRNDWRHAIPQYNLGHGDFLDVMETVEQTHEGLFIGGQLRDGIALPACVEAGIRLADRVLRR